MKIKNDLLRIQASNYDDDGDRLEPEEKPAERILPIDAPVTGRTDGKILGSLPAMITVQGTVAQFAQQVRTQCAGCKWFDQRAFLSYRRANELSKSKIQEMNAIRGALLETGVADFTDDPNASEDVEAQLNMMGICQAITEQMKEPMIVHPESSCPDEFRSEASPDGYYVTLNRDVQKVKDSAFDQIMRQATSKK